ncbi:Cytochrome P450 [Corchorus olitorius]|uniref:Cytochrome P450 n=1 Tax=Corchorus olitorius TaxID=93759 RepID=A0A1R3KM47_9ROSI|nr:Cytochrome P450 [Corchorus olitorius]
MTPSALALLGLLLLLLLATIYAFFFISRNGRKLPPGPHGLPIIGNLHMLGTLPHQNLHHLAKKYGPIMSIRLGNVPAIVVSSPHAAELFLKTHDVVFASRPKIQASEYLSYGSKGMAFTEYGPYWRTTRKWCTLHLLSASKVEQFAPVRKAELRSLVETLKKAAAAGDTVDLTQKVGEVIENIMFKMIFGRSNGTFSLKSVIEETLHLVGAFNLSDYVPFLAPLDLQVILLLFLYYFFCPL